ncbi:MAG: response regulator [Candidatus Riflebacteria bacterium]|nr:response regulator [Candidatus Riflebacteria bacterium]
MRVLIVHQDEEFRNTLKYSFDGIGYEADATGDQGQAVLLYRTNKHEIVFSGHNPPDLDALMLLKTLRSEYPDARVVISNPQADLNQICAAIHLHVFDFFPKKIEFRQLLVLAEEIQEAQQRLPAPSTDAVAADNSQMIAREEQHSRLVLEYARLKQAYEDLRGSKK